MNNALLKLYIKFQNLMSQEEGQDLVEYALIIAIIGVGAVATLGSLATKISGTFSLITADM
jgi:pilus assembly protein Flp/PilA